MFSLWRLRRAHLFQPVYYVLLFLHAPQLHQLVPLLRTDRYSVAQLL
jgi:hypothetical protein